MQPTVRFMYLLLLCTSLLSHLVFGFIDLRGRGCEGSAFRDIVAGLRTNWTGTISFTVDCSDNYDYALDVASLTNYQCKLQDNKWTPDYIPDCNWLMRPDNVSIAFIITLSQDCSNIKVVTVHSKPTIVMANGTLVDIVRVCERTKMLKTCTIEDAIVLCNAELPKQISLSTLIAGRRTLNESSTYTHLYLKLTTAYSNILEEELTHGAALNLQKIVLQYLELPASTRVKSTSSASCRDASLYVLDPKRGMVCRGCSMGHFLSRELKQCIRCPPGQYMERAMSEKCLKCQNEENQALISEDDRLVSVNECFQKQLQSVAQSADTSGMSDATMATLIVTITLVLLVSAAILSLMAQVTVYRKTKLDGLKSQPPSPIDACFAESCSRNSVEEETNQEPAKDRRISSVLALTHGMDDCVGMPLNIT
uniref:Tyrosine-protein kinase ephrin type A/B receptor-like domain-containing protein n=1 Tax=Biomphalaria glabrata TaxID=6526 RepID=A0A2C9M6C6_BIOGL